MNKYLAQTIINNGGRLYPLAVLTLPGDGSHSIEPFVEETAATAYIDGTLVIGSTIPAGFRRVRRCSGYPEVWVCKKDDSNYSADAPM